VREGTPGRRRNGSPGASNQYRRYFSPRILKRRASAGTESGIHDRPGRGDASRKRCPPQGAREDRNLCKSAQPHEGLSGAREGDPRVKRGSGRPEDRTGALEGQPGEVVVNPKPVADTREGPRGSFKDEAANPRRAGASRKGGNAEACGDRYSEARAARRTGTGGGAGEKLLSRASAAGAQAGSALQAGRALEGRTSGGHRPPAGFGLRRYGCAAGAKLWSRSSFPALRGACGTSMTAGEPGPRKRCGSPRGSRP